MMHKMLDFVSCTQVSTGFAQGFAEACTRLSIRRLSQDLVSNATEQLRMNFGPVQHFSGSQLDHAPRHPGLVS
jgi:hypothetical protein